ncbi:MAG: alanine--tRNA ligase [Alphaproteobacteria bacterium]|nr:alanine--tRNA ligase [Alphaproteobacteria bacterium]
MKSVNDIRDTFLDYFGRNDHEVVASSSLVPTNDPTLLFTNAGMVQFKNVFTGGESRAVPRAVTSQKCVRAGGKHNDLENVGHTARHHTFFEMLGNFSFGDYFKEEAIHHAWTLITDIYGLPKDKLLVTVYHDDDDAANWWKKIAGLGDDRIIRIATSDNFWSMGDTGPCGPCSEIFYDHGDHIPGGPPGSPDEDGDRFIEIWNLVFMQYEQLASGERIDLPKPSIDTGMGLERISAVMQGFHDNYDTDLMQSLIRASADVSGEAVDGDHAVSHRVIADHLRASSFLIADGVLPSNEGRGYVLRRIMRRAMRHAHQMGCVEPMMHRLVPALVHEMGGHFTELQRTQSLITETLKMEETRFKETLGRGLKILVDKVDGMPEGSTLDGDTAFKLYDTYGFPIDLTQDVMRGFKWNVDLDGFNAAMDEQKAKARKAWSGSGDSAMAAIYVTAADKLGATEFLGYDSTEAEGLITAIIAGDAEVSAATRGQEVAIITNQTPFYAESGGQVGDQGDILAPGSDKVLARVLDTWKTPTGMFVHKAEVTADLAVGDSVNLKVEAARRDLLKSNHSATHLMHEALREVLGDHVMQKGSQVSPERLRFDFSHTKQVSAEELSAVERIVNSRIRMNSDVTTRLMTPDAAIEEGALALFGEKYGDEVRVVSMGGPTDVEGRSAWSVELCGGTHVNRTGDISLFKVTTEGAVAGGVRRIEAVTSEGAVAWLNHRLAVLDEASAVLKTTPDQLAERVATLVAERRKADQVIAELRKTMAEGGGGNGGSETINGMTFERRVLDNTPAKDLKSIADGILKDAATTVVAIISRDEGKASIVVAVTKDMVDRHDAVSLVRIGSEALGGKGGGGRPDMAQAGGPDASKAEAALDAIAAVLAG